MALAGRELMEKMGMEPQIALTMPLLEGTDGTRKMSKSYGNYIGLTDAPADMFGKTMSIPDEMIGKYYRLASSLAPAEVDAIDAALADGSANPYELKRALGRDMSIPDEMIGKYYRLASSLAPAEVDAIDAALADGSANPYELKRALGRDLVTTYHSAEDAVAAEAEFDRVHKNHDLPTDIAEVSVEISVNDEGLVYLPAVLLADRVHKNHDLPTDIAEVSVEISVNDEGLVYLPAVLLAAGLVPSAGQARRDIDGGGVKLDGEALAPKTYNVDPATLKPGTVLQVGKRKFARLSPA